MTIVATYLQLTPVALYMCLAADSSNQPMTLKLVNSCIIRFVLEALGIEMHLMH